MLLPISLGQLALHLVLVGYQRCQCVVGLVFILFLFLVFLLGLCFSVLRLWYFVLVVGGGRWWRAVLLRSAPFVVLLFLWWSGLGYEDLCFVVSVLLDV